MALEQRFCLAAVGIGIGGSASHRSTSLGRRPLFNNSSQCCEQHAAPCSLEAKPRNQRRTRASRYTNRRHYASHEGRHSFGSSNCGYASPAAKRSNLPGPGEKCAGRSAALYAGARPGPGTVIFASAGTVLFRTGPLGSRTSAGACPVLFSACSLGSRTLACSCSFGSISASTFTALKLIWPVQQPPALNRRKPRKQSH